MRRHLATLAALAVGLAVLGVCVAFAFLRSGS